MVKSYGVVVVACEMKLSSPGTGGTFYFPFPIPRPRPRPRPRPSPSPSRLTKMRCISICKKGVYRTDNKICEWKSAIMWCNNKHNVRFVTMLCSEALTSIEPNFHFFQQQSTFTNNILLLLNSYDFQSLFIDIIYVHYIWWIHCKTPRFWSLLFTTNNY